MRGYFLVAGKKGYLYTTEAKRRTDAVIFYFIDIIAKDRKLCPELVERIKADKETIDRIRHDIEPVTINENRFLDQVTITGHSFTLNYPSSALHKTGDTITV